MNIAIGRIRLNTDGASNGEYIAGCGVKMGSGFVVSQKD